MGAETVPPGSSESLPELGFNQAIKSAILNHPGAATLSKAETGYCERIYYEGGEITPGSADAILQQWVKGEENDYRLTLLHDTFAETGELLIDRYISEREQNYQNINLRGIFYKSNQDGILYKRWLRGNYGNSSRAGAKQPSGNAPVFFRKLEPAEIDTMYQIIDDVLMQRQPNSEDVTKLSHLTRDDLINVEGDQPPQRRNQERRIETIHSPYF